MGSIFILKDGEATDKRSLTQAITDCRDCRPPRDRRETDRSRRGFPGKRQGHEDEPAGRASGPAASPWITSSTGPLPQTLSRREGEGTEEAYSASRRRSVPGLRQPNPCGGHPRFAAVGTSPPPSRNHPNSLHPKAQCHSSPRPVDCLAETAASCDRPREGQAATKSAPFPSHPLSTSVTD